VGNRGLVRVLEKKHDFITFCRNPLHWNGLGLECSGLVNITGANWHVNDAAIQLATVWVNLPSGLTLIDSHPLFCRHLPYNISTQSWFNVPLVSSPKCTMAHYTMFSTVIGTVFYCRKSICATHNVLTSWKTMDIMTIIRNLVFYSYRHSVWRKPLNLFSAITLGSACKSERAASSGCQLIFQARSGKIPDLCDAPPSRPAPGLSISFSLAL